MRRRHVERQRPARLGEAERRRVRRPEALEDAEEARGAGGGQALDHLPQGGLLPEREDELVLHEAAPAVHPVPRPDEVEGVEVAGDRHDLADPPPRCLAVPQLVERLDGDVVDDSWTGDHRRHGQPLPRGVRQRVHGEARWQLVDGGVLATRQDAAPEAPARGHRVDPGDRVPVVAVALVHHRQEVLEVRRPLGVDGAATRLDRQQADRGIEDHAGEAHPTDRRPEQLSALVRSRLDDRAVGEEQCQAGHVGPERSVDVVVLAVDVAGDGPADGDEAGPRGHRHEEAPRDEDLEQLVEADARRDGGRPRDRVQHGVVGVVLEAQHGAPTVLRRVAVGAPHPPDDAATSRQVLDRGPQRLDVP